LKTWSEVFADRTYQDDGSLTPRSLPNALIKDEAKAIEQVMQMIQQKKVKTISGRGIPVVAETVCVHGDGVRAVEFVRAIFNVIK
jgi:UPF0271 protein